MDDHIRNTFCYPIDRIRNCVCNLEKKAADFNFCCFLYMNKILNIAYFGYDYLTFHIHLIIAYFAQ